MDGTTEPEPPPVMATRTRLYFFRGLDWIKASGNVTSSSSDLFSLVSDLTLASGDWASSIDLNLASGDWASSAACG